VVETFVAYGLPEPLFESTQGGMAVTVFKQIEQKTLKKIASLRYTNASAEWPGRYEKLRVSYATVSRAVSASAIHRLAFHNSLPYSKVKENPYDYRNRYQ